MNGRAWISERLLGRCAGSLVLLVLGGLLPGSVQAQLTSFEKAGLSGPLDPALYAGECNFSNLPGIVWWGTETQMTIERLASLAAPIYWFSPDEPLLRGTYGRDIRMPSNLPFEDSASAPVVYYQLDEMVSFEDNTVQEWTLDPDDKGQSMLDISGIGLLRLGYFAYYPSEAGLGAHQHDLEAAELKLAIMNTDGEILPDLTEARCAENNHVIVVTRVVGKAHGIEFFWNISEVDAETKMPFTLLVEEGKHAVGTDKNGDGYFTPTYDVNVRERCLGDPRRDLFRRAPLGKLPVVDDQGQVPGVPDLSTASGGQSQSPEAPAQARGRELGDRERGVRAAGASAFRPGSLRRSPAPVHEEQGSGGLAGADREE